LAFHEIHSSKIADNTTIHYQITKESTHKNSHYHTIFFQLSTGICSGKTIGYFFIDKKAPREASIILILIILTEMPDQPEEQRQ